MWQRCLGLLVLVPLLGACATVPAGPSVMVLPGTSKSFEQFQGDDSICRQWAQHQTGTTPGDAAASSGVGSAVVGTVVGAGLGAAIGAAAGNPGLGAAVGAGSGLFVGSAAGVNAAGYAGSAVQRRYDIAYMQCMYAKGNQVPVSRAPQRAYTSAAPPPPPPPPGVPLPPAGPPPPPPPGPAR